MTIKTICAWCGKLISADTTEKHDIISHGICADCDRKVRSDSELIGYTYKSEKENKTC